MKSSVLILSLLAVMIFAVAEGRNYAPRTPTKYHAPKRPYFQFPRLRWPTITCKPLYHHSQHLYYHPKQDYYRVGSKISFGCSDGYYLKGAKYATCTFLGIWGVFTPRCVPVSNYNYGNKYVYNSGGHKGYY